ncbi:hypothetical protein G6F65_012775 [Rhizopus arrhizus]|nr:hypothetical protein G6F32_017096 [Rhizopus arrhizus]KAG1270905.1 hypothetical protein G6F65_012775 [Rhizopus arrhizus]
MAAVREAAAAGWLVSASVRLGHYADPRGIAWKSELPPQVTSTPCGPSSGSPLRPRMRYRSPTPSRPAPSGATGSGRSRLMWRFWKAA